MRLLIFLVGISLSAQVRIPGPGGLSSAAAVVTFINSGVACGNSGGSTTGAINMTGANFLVIGCAWNSQFNPATADDSLFNTWNPLTSYTGNNQTFRINYSGPADGATVSSSQTFSCTGSNTYAATFVMGFNVPVSGTFDKQNGNNCASQCSSGFQTGSVSPTVNGELLVTGFLQAAASTYAIDSGFVTPPQVSQQFSSGNCYGGALTYLIQGVKSAVNPAWTTSAGSQYSPTAIATFEP